MYILAVKCTSKVTYYSSLPSTRARLPLPHNNRTIGADNRESPTIQMHDFDQFLSEIRYCHQLQNDSCRAGL